MKAIACFSFIIVLSSLGVVSANAAALYRQRPTTITMTPQDKVYISYNFAEKTGIRCSSSQVVHADFVYKGKQKSAPLPLVLQSDHVPDKENEVLADVSGRLVLYVPEAGNEAKEFEVNCDYVDRK